MRLTRRGTRGSELGSSTMTRVESRGGSVTTQFKIFTLKPARAGAGELSPPGGFELGGASILVGGFNVLPPRKENHPKRPLVFSREEQPAGQREQMSMT